MQQLIESLGIAELHSMFKNRLILSSFCLLIFVILIYFWGISKSKIKANNKDGSGLVYLSFAFLLHAILGVISVFYPLQTPLLILSALINLCFISSLSFFSLGTHQVDTIVSQASWKNGVKYVGFGLVILISIMSESKPIYTVDFESSLPIYAVDVIESKGIFKIDMVISILSVLLLGFYITRFFIRRKLNFIALITGGYFASFVLLLLVQSGGLDGGKFAHISTVMLAPVLFLAVILLAYTFNWFNELSFYELSSIWVSKEEGVEKEAAYAKLTVDDHRDDWMTQLANDEIETVIDEIIILKKHRNENLEAILNIASRNTRNNNNHLKDLIKYEDYQLNRNKISNSLLSMVQA